MSSSFTVLTSLYELNCIHHSPFTVCYCSDQILLPDRAPRWTSTELEVDVSARDILNRLELENVSDSNPGLVALWDEERARRASHSVSSAPLPEMPNPDDLLPLTIPMEIPNDMNDLVSDWLQDSQSSESGEWNVDATEREQRNQHSVPELDIFQPETERKTSQSSAAPSCVSVMTSLSSVSRQDLLRLAQATEEADAPVPQIDESLGTDWSFLRSAAEKSFMGQSQNFFSEVHGSILSVCNPDHSQDLLATQSSLGSPMNGLSSCTLTAGHSAVHSRGNVVGDFDTDDSEDIDALLVAHATKVAVSYLSGQLTQSSHNMSKQVAVAGEDASHLEVEDDLVMSKRIHSDEDAPPSIPDAFWVSVMQICAPEGR
ncbi:putative DNA polymerase zeta catalytic subunit [Fasciola gigantica]|uniref:Putative DNA polymerase zeta catalytic subunit n=1 Tax=Fasciola gigantica TaxID=46835 RepID=A0A504Z278_FASGI|nr:putative DNA polymerase zeta catalytic subunit [Fasciola gigantica]